MKSTSIKTAAATAAIALLATPAFAQGPQEPPQQKGHATSPAKICKNESRKKTNHGKGKSPFAACVIGAARQQREAQRQPDENEQRAPGRICRDQSRKKDANDTKSPFAACVKGVTETRKQQREAQQS
ncbi:MAG TPA: hypothetical protein VGW75_11005 [Solirubrobacteraceae bacterium]|jgi:hypothetical protein|nr:hypothetical protein [Solirubrobacteraceae bacterium]